MDRASDQLKDQDKQGHRYSGRTCINLATTIFDVFGVRLGHTNNDNTNLL